MIDRYVIRLVLLPSLAGFGLLIMLVTAFNAGELLRDPVVSQFPASYVIQQLLLQDITASEVLLPTAVYMGLLVTMTHWHRDREAWVFYAAGVTPRRLNRPVVIIAVTLALVIGFLSLYGRPWAFAQSYALEARAAFLSTDVMAPHQFYKWSDQLVISAEEIDDATGDMMRVFIQESSAEGTRVVRASTGRIHLPDPSGRQRVELNNGSSYWMEHVSSGDRASVFKKLTYVSAPAAESGRTTKRRARSTFSLFDSTAPKEVAELQWRLSMPLLAFFVALIGAELTRALPNANVYSRYLLGIAVYAVVFNVAAMGRTWVENGLVGATPGMYWVPVMVAGAYLVIRLVPRLSLARPQ